MSERYFYGWNVGAATFVMALFSFGLGFYGLSVYVATPYPGGQESPVAQIPGREARVPRRRSLLSIGPLCRLCATRSRSPARPLFWGWSPALASNGGLAPQHLMVALRTVIHPLRDASGT